MGDAATLPPLSRLRRHAEGEAQPEPKPKPVITLLTLAL